MAETTEKGFDGAELAEEIKAIKSIWKGRHHDGNLAMRFIAAPTKVMSSGHDS